jgi:prepilin peptidase CpaA
MPNLQALIDLPARLLASPSDIVLVILLAAAAAIDWRVHRIPNGLTVGGMAFGLLYNAAVHGLGSGLLPAIAGLAAGLALLLPLYALRVMGAGDVKLMAMVGAFLGISQIAQVVVCTFIAGGIAALVFAIWHRAVRRMTANVADIAQSMVFAAIVGLRPSPELSRRPSIGKLPYAVSIAAGTIGWLVAGLAGLG